MENAVHWLALGRNHIRRSSLRRVGSPSVVKQSAEETGRSAVPLARVSMPAHAGPVGDAAHVGELCLRPAGFAKGTIGSLVLACCHPCARGRESSHRHRHGFILGGKLFCEAKLQSKSRPPKMLVRRSPLDLRIVLVHELRKHFLSCSRSRFIVKPVQTGSSCDSPTNQVYKRL